MAVDQNGDTQSDDKLERSILGFEYNKYADGIPHEIFLLLIMTTMANFDVSKILIDGEISCDIMYKVRFEERKLSTYT